jgi:protein-tyrosine phosphatase
MDDRFYRGSCPKKGDFRALAALGINTVVDLRKKADPLERIHVEELGMQYINIPMSDKEYPPSEHIDAFLNLIKDSTAGKFFVHCAGGRHRTGVIGAVYRLTINHWNYDQVYSEMKSYDFYTLGVSPS